MDAIELAKEWLSIDRDPDTRSEIELLICKNNIDELEKRLRLRIAFGTAGLRARAEAGFSRMNCLTVIQTSQGLAQYLIDTKPGSAEAGIVIGFDGRRDSKRFAEVAAAAFASYGFSIIWFENMVHTPLVPFTVRNRKAAAGVMITASHNPKQDNGYKVYGSNGCQINTPEDEAISASILKNLEPRSWTRPMLEDQRAMMVEVYFTALKAMVPELSIPKFVYTPLHGVGLCFMFGALEGILDGGADAVGGKLHVVAAQAQPDPNFSTVPYPNPEEQGTLDLAKSHADNLGIDLIIANDPDADRLAVGQRVRSGWHIFKGDEIGTLLGYYIFKSKIELSSTDKAIMLNSAVSSEMLAAIGRSHGFTVLETLTGFKWIGNEAWKIGADAVFGYEEALGFMLTSIVHDKDGIAAALTLLQACSEWKRLPYEILQELYECYGYFDTANTYFKTPDTLTTKRTFDAVRSDPMAVSRALGGETFCRVRDLVSGTDTGLVDGKSTLPVLPDNLMITFWLSGHPALYRGVKCTIRASGTEPKIKQVYIECRSENSLEEAQTGALNVLKLVRSVWFGDPSLQIEARYETL